MTNYGNHTVARLRAHLLKDDGTPVDIETRDLISRSPAQYSDRVMNSDMDTIRSPQVLPAGAGIRLRSAEVPREELTAPNVLVRWRDYSGHEWEHNHARGEVRKLSDEHADEW